MNRNRDEYWEGEDYSNKKLLILGESTFLVDEENRSIREQIGNFTMNPDKERSCYSLFWALTRSLWDGSESSTSEYVCHVKSIWRDVAFINFVSGKLLSRDTAHRPTEDVWNKARDEFRPLLRQLRPKCILVLGLPLEEINKNRKVKRVKPSLWDRLPPFDACRQDQALGKIKIFNYAQDLSCECIAVGHPTMFTGIRKEAIRDMYYQYCLS
jgi:hypothetical protein